MKLLIVENSPILRERLRSVFEEVPGLKTLSADRVVHAVARFRGWRPDMVILDIHLPDGSGIAVLRTIKEAQLCTRVLMFSNCPDYREYCQAQGADDFFDKSLEFEDLVRTVGAIAAEEGVALPARPQA